MLLGLRRYLFISIGSNIHKMRMVQHLLVTCFLLTLITMVTSTEEVENTFVKTDPSSIKKAVRGNVVIRCTTNVANTTLNWLDSNKNVISANTSNRVHITDSSTLMLNNVEVNDTGLYTCMTADGAHNATAMFTVYVMPDYFFEGMVILIINASLILIFFSCLLHTWIMSRRQKSKQIKAEQKQAL